MDLKSAWNSSVTFMLLSHLGQYAMLYLREVQNQLERIVCVVGNGQVGQFRVGRLQVQGRLKS